MADRQRLVHLIIIGFKVLPNEIPFLVLYSETLGKQQKLIGIILQIIFAQ